MALSDTTQRYGLITRLLHWAMAALLAWQFGGMILKSVLGRTPLMKFWVGSHASIGSLLLLLILLRCLWALLQLRHRPPLLPGGLGVAARGGHLLLYLLMLVVPALAFLRMIGSGKGVTLFGSQWLAPSGEATTWMMAPANALHGTLAWVLLAAIAGHIVMVLVHRYLWRDGVLARMWGNAAARR